MSDDDIKKVLETLPDHWSKTYVTTMPATSPPVDVNELLRTMEKFQDRKAEIDRSLRAALLRFKEESRGTWIQIADFFGIDLIDVCRIAEYPDEPIPGRVYDRIREMMRFRGYMT